MLTITLPRAKVRTHLLSVISCREVITSQLTAGSTTDGRVYYKINDVHIELYTDYKNTELELKVEEVLDRHNIFYNKSEVWIDSEKLYEVMYSYEIGGICNAE